MRQKMAVMTQDAFKLMMDGAKALSIVETNGIRVDTDYLEKTIESVSSEIKQIEDELRSTEVWQKWVKLFGQKSKIGSLEQLGRILYDKKKDGGLGYDCTARTPTGRPKVSEAVIEELHDLPFAARYVRMRRLLKMRGTFLYGIKREQVDSYLHATFNQHLALTYRSTSTDINFQNFPVRNPELATMIRRCFIARPGHVLAEVDYSGIEVKVAACYNKDPNLIRYIEDPSTDMHRDTACRLFFLKPEEVSKPVRHTAKNKFVFPQFYGSYYVDCAKSIWDGISRGSGMWVEGSNETETVLDRLASKGIQSRGACDDDTEPSEDTFEYHVRQVENWFWQKRFKVYTEWKEQWWNQYLRRGFFRMKTGFVCHGLYRRNQVINYPVQGAAFHCLLWSLIEIQKWLSKNRMKSKIVGQIHDSIVFDLHKSEVDDVLTMARIIMTKRLPRAWPWIIVPLDTETEVCPDGGSWADKVQWVRKNKVWGPK